jgi:protoporphyrinogen/coproporphyrinogen III oxidase
VPRVAVIGAGVSGIAAALELEKAGVEFLVLESSPEAGGVLRSHSSGGFVFDDGPSSILEGDGAARAFFRELGLEADIVESRPEARERYVWHDGALRDIPSKPGELATTPLLSILERVRFLKEPFTAPAPAGVEETVSEFVARRFGKGLAAKFADVIVSGIWCGDPARLSLDACFPEIRALERAHGSLLKGMEARAKERRAAGAPRAGGMISLSGGLGRVGPAARVRLGERLRTGTRVAAVEPRGEGFVLETEAGGASERLDADAVILAGPAHAAAALPGALPPAVATLLASIEHASLAVVQAGFLRQNLPGLPPGFGFLVPRAAKLESVGWLFVSQIFDGRAPEGCVALTGFYGGMLGQSALMLDQRGELGVIALHELATVLGLRGPPAPEILRIVRWQRAIPQYVLGHQNRIADARARLASERPGIVLAGNYLGGVSIPSCLESGREAARALIDRRLRPASSRSSS